MSARSIWTTTAYLEELIQNIISSPMVSGSSCSPSALFKRFNAHQSRSMTLAATIIKQIPTRARLCGGVNADVYQLSEFLVSPYTNRHVWTFGDGEMTRGGASKASSQLSSVCTTLGGEEEAALATNTHLPHTVARSAALLLYKMHAE